MLGGVRELMGAFASAAGKRRKLHLHPPGKGAGWPAMKPAGLSPRGRRNSWVAGVGLAVQSDPAKVAKGLRVFLNLQ
jgi:hypothetical protein